MIKTATMWFLRQMLRSASVRTYLQRQLSDNPQLRFAPPGHFYSPLPDLSTIDSPEHAPHPSPDDGVDLNIDGQRRLLDELSGVAKDFDWPEAQTPARRFWIDNGFYLHGDSVVLFSFIRRFRPRRIIEVGSGFSSALMLDANEFFCDSSIQLTFIEPHPERLRGLLRPRDDSTARIVVAPIQRVPLHEFDALEAGDVLFIDSSHVSKFGSDVNFLMFSVIPRLRPGVIVHIHDIFFPFEYPLPWLRSGRAWNELYMVRAFLQFNRLFEIMFFNSFMGATFPDDVKRLIPLMGVDPGCSIWLRRM